MTRFEIAFGVVTAWLFGLTYAVATVAGITLLTTTLAYAFCFFFVTAAYRAYRRKS